MNSPQGRNSRFESLANEAKDNISTKFYDSKIKQFAKELLISSNKNHKAFQNAAESNEDTISTFKRSRSPQLERKIQSTFLDQITRSKLSNMYNEIYGPEITNSPSSKLLNFSSIKTDFSSLSPKPSHRKIQSNYIGNAPTVQKDPVSNTKITNAKKELITLLGTSHLNNEKHDSKRFLTSSSPMRHSCKNNISSKLKDNVEFDRIKVMRKGINNILNKENMQNKHFVYPISLALTDFNRTEKNGFNNNSKKMKKNNKELNEEKDNFYSPKKGRMKIIDGKIQKEKQIQQISNITEMLKNKMKLYGLAYISGNE